MKKEMLFLVNGALVEGEPEVGVVPEAFVIEYDEGKKVVKYLVALLEMKKESLRYDYNDALKAMDEVKIQGMDCDFLPEGGMRVLCRNVEELNEMRKRFGLNPIQPGSRFWISPQRGVCRYYDFAQDKPKYTKPQMRFAGFIASVPLDVETERNLRNDSSRVSRLISEAVAVQAERRREA